MIDMTTQRTIIPITNPANLLKPSPIIANPLSVVEKLANSPYEIMMIPNTRVAITKTARVIRQQISLVVRY